MILPFEKGDVKITSCYGKRTLYGAESHHSGLDLVGVSSDKVISVCDGVVLWSKIVTDRTNPTWEWGNYVAITGEDGNTIYYCHLAKRKVVAGQRVKAGDVIGIMGNTGYSYGKHLHFEVRPANLTATNAANYLHLPNAVCEISEKEYYSDEVIKACGLTAETRTHISKYAWSADLWRKLAIAIQQKDGKTNRSGVIQRCGFLPHTVKHLDTYKFAVDLWRKLGERMGK